MADIKQANFRLDQAAADNFRKFCEENSYSQAEGFDYLMQLLSINKTIETAPGRKTEIESFKRSIEAITQTYLASVDLCTDTENRVRSQYDAALTSKDTIISDLQEKARNLEESKRQAMTSAEASAKAAAQAIKDMVSAQQQAETAGSLVAEKDRTIETLTDRLTAAEAKVTEYDNLARRETEAQEQIRSLFQTIEACKADHEREIADLERNHADALKAADRTLQTEKDTSERALADAEKDHTAAIRELQAQMERKISDAKKDAALEVANAVAETERKYMDKLREADRENARLQAEVSILREQLGQKSIKRG